jgi:methylated-DNA-[protein]-cysteine S-methyltransferase
MKTPAADTVVCTDIPTPLGGLLLAATDAGLAGAWFHEGQRDTPPSGTVAGWTRDAAHPLLQAAARSLERYFAGDRVHFDLPLDLSAGTEFQQAVWQALCLIEPGRTVSYGDVARAIGRTAAVRAVGAAVGANPVSVIVPCHRVVGAHGSLTGYSGGLHRKVALLSLESGEPRLF